VIHDHQIRAVGGVEFHGFLTVRRLKNFCRRITLRHDAPHQEPGIFLKLNNDKIIVFHGRIAFRLRKCSKI